MIVTYALQPHPKSIFLAGPTPRDKSKTASWRPEAIQMLADMGFDGEVIVPETSTWDKHDRYDEQIEWEWEGIHRATTVAFWVPRIIETMPAFTTNIEYGLMVANSNVVLGYPKDALKMGYLQALATRYHVPVHSTLYDTLASAMLTCQRWALKAA